MLRSRITGKAQTTIPKPVREALGLREGDDIAYEIQGDRVILRRYDPADPLDDPFVNFTEWAGEADKAYDALAERFPARTGDGA